MLKSRRKSLTLELILILLTCSTLLSLFHEDIPKVCGGYGSLHGPM